MKYLGEAGKDPSNGSRRITYMCECGAIGTTRWARFSPEKSCRPCTQKGNRLKSNAVTVCGPIARIDVSTDKFPGAICIIDAEDVPLVIDGRGRWFATDFGSGVVYVVRGSRSEKIHRLIKQAPDGAIVDHQSGDGLDNRKTNLVVCGQLQNTKNRKLDRRNLSGFHGVVPSPTPGKWVAQGSSDGEKTHLGTYASISDAAAARAAYESANGFSAGHGRLSSGPKESVL